MKCDERIDGNFLKGCLPFYEENRLSTFFMRLINRSTFLGGFQAIYHFMRLVKPFYIFRKMVLAIPPFEEVGQTLSHF